MSEKKKEEKHLEKEIKEEPIEEEPVEEKPAKKKPWWKVWQVNEIQSQILIGDASHIMAVGRN